MKRVVMLALVVAGVLMINACQDEEITVRDDSTVEPKEILPDIKDFQRGGLPYDTEIE